jgi:hypothetical protein
MSKKLKDEIKAKSSLRQLQQGEISFSQYFSFDYNIKMV